MSKRRARTARYGTQPGRPASSVRAKAVGPARGSPVLMLAIVGGSVLVLVAILVFALSRSSSVATTAATPTGGSLTPGIPQVAQPAAGVGVLDPGAGLAQPAPPLAINRPAPDFSWQMTTGHTSLSALRGHPVILEMFAPWCATCKRDVPILNGFLALNKAKGLQVLSVTGSPFGKDYETTGSQVPVCVDDLIWFKQTNIVTYPLILDPSTRVFNLYGKGQSASVPTFFIIDRHGVLRYSDTIAVNDSDLAAQVKAVL